MMLQVKNLYKSYGKTPVLKGVNFEIEKGDIFGFLGRNGAGKTTTMNILTGLIKYNSGEVYFAGEKFKSDDKNVPERIGYVPQEPVFYDYMTGPEYLQFVGKLTSISSSETRKRISEVMKIAGLENSGRKKIREYSGGMKQRFAIAVAIFNKPDMLFLDEPTSSLDPQGRLEILNYIKSLREEGITVFLSTHILNDIERICNKVSILEKGEIILSGSLDEISEKYILPIYDIEIEENPELMKSIFEGISWVEKLNVDGKTLSVHVNDIDQSGKEIIKLLASSELAIRSFIIRKSNLEDIFMRLLIDEHV